MTLFRVALRVLAREEARALLVCEQDDVADLHAARRVDDIGDRIGDVVGRQWLDVFVDVRRTFLVAVEAHFGKRRLDHPRLDRRDLDIRRHAIDADAVGERLDGGLRRAIDGSARVRVEAGRRAEVHDVAAVALDHRGQKRVRDEEQAFDVRVDHLEDVFFVRLIIRLEAAREAGVVDEHVRRAKFFEHDGRRLVDARRIRDIEHERRDRDVLRRFDVLLHRFEFFQAAARDDEVVAFFRERFRRRLADAARRARDECVL